MRCLNRSDLTTILSCIVLAGWPAVAGATSWEVGAKAGANVAGFGGDSQDLHPTLRRLGFAGGGFAAYHVFTNLALQGEVLYSMKGAMTPSSIFGQGTAAEVVWKLDYVEVPILLRFSTPSLGRLSPDLIAGPSLAFNVNAEYENKTSSVKSDIDNVKTLDVGLILGVGAHFGGGPLRYLVEGRYSRGFSDIYDLQGNAETIHDVFSILVGVSH